MLIRALIALAAAASGFFLSTLIRSQIAAPTHDASFIAWREIPRAEQATYTREWRDLQGREDAAAVLDRAAKFAALALEQKTALRRLHELQSNEMRAASAQERVFLLGLAPAARAVAILKRLEEHNPAAIEEIRRTFSPEKGR